MKKLLFCFALLTGFAALASEPYHIRTLSEKELLQTYTSIMHDACRYDDQFWHDWSVDPRAGYWGSGRSDNMNEGIRSISDMTLTRAALLRYSNVLSDSERSEYRRKLIAGLRYAVATHVSGSQKCTDGKPWGNSWQSAMWTGNLGFSAWLIWDDLDADLRKDIERILAYESDRFLGGKPPAGTFNDTKAEENGWDLTCIALTSAMFPNNPHASAWREKAIEYAMNTLSAPQDATDTNLVDGKPVKEWYTGANVHPDFTLENHGFFHPGYIGCSSYFMTQTEMYYTFAHQRVPQAAYHHLLDEWHMFQGLILPDGEAACPQSMDWELHGLPYVNLFASLACSQHDALASHFENNYVQYVRAWQLMENGNMAVAGSPLGFTRHAICSEETTWGFLAHKIFGPAARPLSARKAAAQVAGVHLHEWVQVASHRTPHKYVSFSWTNRVMGMVIPLGAGHEGNPDFTAPIQNGFVGGFEPAPKGKNKPTAVEHSWKKTGDGFETTGTLLLNGGKLKETLRMTSIGEKTVVYEDRVTALEDVTVSTEHGVPIGIENDKVTGGTRELFWQDGHAIFDYKKPQKPLALSGSWANVDGRLGVVMAVGGNLSYNQAKSYQGGISICEDILYGSYSTQPKHFKKGDEVAHRVAIVFLETSSKETKAAAKTVKIEELSGSRMLHFKSPGAGESEVSLLE